MKWHRLKLVALVLAPAVLYACWKGSHAIFESLQCVGSLQGAQPCTVHGLDVTPVLSALAWWGMLLWLPALVIAILALGQELSKNVRARR